MTGRYAPITYPATQPREQFPSYINSRTPVPSLKFEADDISEPNASTHLYYETGDRDLPGYYVLAVEACATVEAAKAKWAEMRRAQETEALYFRSHPAEARLARPEVEMLGKLQLVAHDLESVTRIISRMIIGQVQ